MQKYIEQDGKWGLLVDDQFGRIWEDTESGDQQIFRWVDGEL